MNAYFTLGSAGRPRADVLAAYIADDVRDCDISAETFSRQGDIPAQVVGGCDLVICARIAGEDWLTSQIARRTMEAGVR